MKCAKNQRRRKKYAARKRNRENAKRISDGIVAEIKATKKREAEFFDFLGERIAAANRDLHARLVSEGFTEKIADDILVRLSEEDEKHFEQEFILGDNSGGKPVEFLHDRP